MNRSIHTIMLLSFHPDFLDKNHNCGVNSPPPSHPSVRGFETDKKIKLGQSHVIIIDFTQLYICNLLNSVTHFVSLGMESSSL